ncbi:MAG: hypothetical protein L6R39_000090 [Caloplaca ligustica]|nr:MAG: hypothetical protein L6R39_000090 [Caloplaca ligustica]
MQQAFQDRGLALLGDPSDPPGYPSGQPIYFNAPDLIVDAPKGHARQYQQRYTPSGSPSPSVPHSLDQPPSTLSSTSGASGPSTASSTVGSPYSLATHSLSGPDAWSELNQGLGIAPDIVHNESFTQDAFPNGSLEGELCYQDGKFADNFVVMTLIDQGQRDFEAEQHPLISAPRHINLTLEDPRPDERRLRRAYQGFPRKMHGLQVLDSRKTAKNAVDSERPEKCPIVTCEYHHKGFARKYDKNRHTLTHYKGTMVCGFCPGSGSAAEKSFNRADVFKRHLTTLHGVEQTPPNSRKKSPTASNTKKASDYSGDAAGKCSTCSAMFNNAQEFYEHLDDCVLRVVQQEEPSEAINEQRLAEVANDESVLETLDRNMVHAGVNVKPFDADGDDADVDGTDLKDETHPDDWTQFTRNKPRSGNRGVPLMKKRVLCVYDGPRRLWKDDMMLDSQFEVRMRLGEGDSYVTDLDVNTLKRADALLNATDEEKGPWIPDDEADVQRLMS